MLCGVLVRPRGTTAQESRCQQCPPLEYAEKIRAFGEFVRASMQGDHIPGMTVGFALGDYTWAEGFGYANWSRTWNDYTRSLVITPETDFDAVGARLRKEFANAEVYPDYVAYLQPIQQDIAALKAPKLGVDLYPSSDELLFNLAYFIIVYGQSEGGRAAIKAVVPDHEPPAAYLRRAFESNPDGVMRAQTFLDIGDGWLKRPDRTGAGVELLGAAAVLHTKDAAVQEMFGDFLVRAGRKADAEANYRKAFALDPNVAKGSTLDAYLAGKIPRAPAATLKP